MLDLLKKIISLFLKPNPTALPEPKPVMLILRGIAGEFDGQDWPRGALYEAPALAYAERRGYVGQVLDVDGATGEHSAQVQQAVMQIVSHPEITALYGFSGGAYNVRHILEELEPAEAVRIKLVVVLGAPNNPPNLYRKGPWELVYRLDPPKAQGGHMGGPQALLDEGTKKA